MSPPYAVYVLVRIATDPATSIEDRVSVIGFFGTEQAARDELARQQEVDAGSGFQSFIRPVQSTAFTDPPWEYTNAFYDGRNLYVCSSLDTVDAGDDADVVIRRYTPTPEELARQVEMNARLAAPSKNS